MIAIVPTASGSSAATTLPKATTSNTRITGTAMLSANARSAPTCSLMSSSATAGPPTVTCTAPASPLYRSAIEAESPSAMFATTNACVPSTDFIDGAPVSQYEATCESSGSAASRSDSATPESAAGPSSTVPVSARTTKTRSDSPPNLCSSSSAAAVDSAAGSSKPPVCSFSKAPIPTNATAARTTTQAASTSRARRTTKTANRSNMTVLPCLWLPPVDVDGQQLYVCKLGTCKLAIDVGCCQHQAERRSR